AAEELVEFMENGNIVNSVNYPNCSLGPCTSAGRVAIFHRNVKNTISQYTAVCGDAGINISDMTDKSRGEYAYCLIDLDSPVTDELFEKLSAVESVMRVRVIC
ncbi:MAG: 3-phosphoglycerate dehydrogenase, partial [Oscillospiraceae bacterium]|nr:3-phosphoglycerate dehydrogenase [Oscillospiraceae bacterium]